MNASHVILAAPFLTAGMALSFVGLHRQIRLQGLYLYWGLFVLAVFCFCLTNAFGRSLGPFSPLFAAFGSTTCGFSWLLSRALFRPPQAARLWPLAVVTMLVVTGIGLDFLSAFAPSLAGGGVAGSIGKVHMLTSSTVLLLALIEPVEGLRRSLPEGERRFRLAFAGVYAALLATGVLWERESGAPLDILIKVSCSMLAAFAASCAVLFRARHPLPASAEGTRDKARRPAAERTVTEADRALAGRIASLLNERRLYTDAEIKVADLAALAGEPEYKVSRAITGALGYPNFNRLLNEKRVAHARALLADPDCGWSVLAVALDSGFGSIGPFNRAFKEETGMTAGRYRAASRERGVPGP